jgi:aryl-alcohol dehydrogenase-like predicted oxidoreductase
MLSGKYTSASSLPEGSRAGDPKTSAFMGKYLNDETLGKVTALRQIAADCGLPLAHLALAWILRQPGVASALVGATRPEQVAENAKASGVVLSKDVLQHIEDVLEPKEG